MGKGRVTSVDCFHALYPINYAVIPYIYNTLCGYGIGLGSLYRDTFMSDGAQRFYTTHIQYINREYVFHTKLETVWIGSDQIRFSTFNIFLHLRARHGHF
jgi:hypothetical protein